jgi:AraC-like DNA-binding protein
VTQIALAAGFNSMSHFSSAFRRRFGVTPSDARDRA